MTIQECINASLQLINQYSIAGTIIPLSYNDQSDDITRMLPLINDAMMEIATTARPIIETEEFVVPKIDDNVPSSELEFEMPDDCNHPGKIFFTPLNGSKTIDAMNYKFINDEKTLLLPNRPAGTYTVEYERFPVQFTSETSRQTELDNTPDTHVIIPFYVGAMVCLDDNTKAYYSLYNVWETRLSRLNMRPARATYQPVADVYGFF